jgi:hypothetical protein
MPILPFMKNQVKINSKTVVSLSTAGEAKAERMTMGGDYGEVLSTLRSEEICTVSEIAQRTGMSEQKVVAIIRDLTPAFIAIKSTQSD